MEHRTHEQTSKGIFPLVQKGLAARIYIDPEGRDYDGMSLVAASFAGDVELITGIRPVIVTDAKELSKIAVIAGSLGNNRLIDALAAEGRIDAAAIQGKRETYMIRPLEHPFEGVEQAIVIAGSDKRGTFYGIYHLSEMIGVSPWVYWGDVVPKKRRDILLPTEQLQVTSKEPSIRYRGFFINDEWPSFGTWTNNRFGGFNEDMYRYVFELLLRLKGNYLWPAMWSAVFSEDGKRHPLANAELAHAYGIIMGTSHHEPMFRAGEEWGKVYRQYTDRYDWDFGKNREAITRFWEDGVKRNREFESIITLGMRGERDSALGGTVEENIERLKDIILTQKEILRKHGLQDAPQTLVIYKEVEKFWHGTEDVPGLKDWDVLDDVIIMLSDDNFGNVRTLPRAEDRDRPAGWGLYYHFDYHGGPVSYEWVNTIPLQKIWEQMTMAYDYGIRELWIVNVGDLKPMELPLSYFMDLAYDYDTWGAQGLNRTEEYTRRWCRQQFGHAVEDQETLDGIAKVLTGYTRMNGNRKPEVTYPDTYSLHVDREAERELARAIQLEREAEQLYQRMPVSLRDAYYQLVYYPAVASANVKKMQIYAAYNRKYAHRELPSTLANRYAGYVEQAIARDIELQDEYNYLLSNGKWRGMMSSPHVGYVRWNAEGWSYPQVSRVQPKPGSRMIVDVQGQEEGFAEGTAALPAFTNLMKEVRTLTVSNEGADPFSCTIEADVDWLVIAEQTEPIPREGSLSGSNNWQGTVHDGIMIEAAVDWERLTESAEGTLTIKGAGHKVEVRVQAEVIDVQGIPEGTFIETGGIVSIEAEHTVRRAAVPQAEWKVIEGYGRTLSSLKMFPTTVSFQRPEEAPYLEYRIWIKEDGDYTLTAYTAPTNNLSHDSRLRYAVSFDGEEPVIADTLPEDFAAGESPSWGRGVLENIHLSTTAHRLSAGLHTLRFYGLDAGLVLQKLVLSKEPLTYSYYGPVESYRIPLLESEINL